VLYIIPSPLFLYRKVIDEIGYFLFFLIYCSHALTTCVGCLAITDLNEYNLQFLGTVLSGNFFFVCSLNLFTSSKSGDGNDNELTSKITAGLTGLPNKHGATSY
jgi:zinc transporter ZupT